MLLTKPDRDYQCFGKRLEDSNGKQKSNTVLPTSIPGLPSGNTSTHTVHKVTGPDNIVERFANKKCLVTAPQLQNFKEEP